MPTLDFDDFDVLTFDCYGTLIDWERGILDALRAPLAAHAIEAGDDDLLQAFGRHEAEVEAGPYRPYREVLAEVLGALVARSGGAQSGGAQSGGAASGGAQSGGAASAEERAAFGGSVAEWPAFPDSAAALARLHERFKLGVITNCDDDLFAASEARLGVTFDWVVTAQQTRRYKPNPRGFELMFERVGLPPARILHVAQSLFHDHVPAKRLGLSTVWIDRRAGRAGSGATPVAEARPDMTMPDMATLASLAVPE